MIEENTIIQTKYKIIKFIGSGTFSNVYLAKNIIRGINVVIKFENGFDIRSKLLLKNEINAYLYLLKHNQSHSVSIKSYGIYNDLNYIIMEELYMDLETFFKNKSDDLSLHDIYYRLEECITLVTNMHLSNIVHRDIKPDNFLFNKSKKLCIIDLGLSSKYDTNKILSKCIGTPLFSSPTTHKPSYVYNKQDDILSIFFMFFYLITEKLPWDNIFCNELKSKDIIYYYLKKDTNFFEYYKKNCSVHKYINLVQPFIKTFMHYKSYGTVAHFLPEKI